ncbi:hypothetical protein APE_0691 [Aeropyrum pernix K1]|uniref:Type II secretion system protein GspF domain-containing protein n=1 Tax=Aeropyrum pernix (strain ATCC 700893 / DSM 11879 / JCM 9820 / NBRC 100138 / K1) TaxID=272557 RepID=Q9YE79_AERPE|nr:type II secretion system F family protein [Aeropyrum pernix]BAA79667.1 hypothetical protein APE_0691 [Aeropyrum pernix K1]
MAARLSALKMRGRRLLHVRLHSLSDPLLLGAGAARLSRYSLLAMLSLTFLAAASLILWLSGYTPYWLPLLAGGAAAAAGLAPTLYRAVVGGMVEREVPLLLLYMLPYSSIASNVADLLLASYHPSLRWARREVERLRLMVKSGLDPEAAARLLARTTPSKTLGAMLREYIAAERLGLSRSRLTLYIIDYTMKAIKTQWDSYTRLAQSLGEINLTLVSTALLLTPMAILVEPQAAAAAALLPAVASPALALFLAALKPPIGWPPGNTVLALTSYAAPAAMVAAFALATPLHALAAGAALAVAVEAGYRLQSIRERRALESLGAAVAKARAGLDFSEDLANARQAAGPVVDVVISASTTAGRTGVSKAVEAVYNTILESRLLARRAKTVAVILGAASVAVPAIAILLLKVIGEASASWQASQVLVPLDTLEATASLIMTVSPLIPVPAAVLQRPGAPSPLYSLAAAALAYAAAGAPAPAL